MRQAENPLYNFFQLFVSMTLAMLLKLYRPEISGYSIFGLGLFLAFSLRFFSRLGKSIPIKELIILIALLQWVIAPILSYHFYKASEFYYMCIDEERYMGFVVIATIALIAGLFFPIGGNREPEGNETEVENPAFYSRRGWILLVLGITCFALNPFVPLSLNYFFRLLSHTSIVGSLYLLKARNRYQYLLMFVAFSQFFIQAAETTIFHEVFIWGGFLVIMYTFIHKSTVFTKSLLLSGMMISIFLINSVKKEFRDLMNIQDLAKSDQLAFDQQPDLTQDQGQTQVPGQKKTKGKSSTNQLFGMVSDKLNASSDDAVTQQESRQGFVDRLNQGWIIARIMYVVPQYTDFAGGQTIKDGIYAALLPRIFAPNKAVSGGGTNFERFTGLPLAGASMNLGIVGEAYANYGETWGWLFLFIYGLFFNMVDLVVYRKSRLSPDFILWLPFLFFFVIKAEEDFTTIFNQFIKSVIVMMLIFYLFKRTDKETPFHSA